MANWLVDLFTVLYYAALVATAIIILGILLGVIPKKVGKQGRFFLSRNKISIKPKNGGPENIDSIASIGIPQVGNRIFAYSPRELWGTIKIKKGGKEVRVPYPDFQWWTLLDPEHKEIKKQLQQQFLEHWRSKVAGAYIYAATLSAHDFLREIEEELNSIGTSFDVPNSHDHPSPAEMIYVFDIYATTGKNLLRAYKNLPSGERHPESFLVLILNDLVPAEIRVQPQLEEIAKIECIYLVGDYIESWSRVEIGNLLSKIKSGLRGSPNWDWFDEGVQKNIEELQHLIFQA